MPHRLALVDDASPEATLVVDRAGVVVSANAAARSMYGSAPALEGRSLAELHAADQAKVIAEALGRAADGAYFQAETQLALPDGSRMPLCETIRRVPGPPGEDGACVVTWRELSTMCTVVDALRASEDRFRLLFDHLQVGVLVQGPHAEILMSNPKALELLGLTEDQLLGRSSFDPSWGVVHENGEPFPGPTHPVPVAIATRSPVQGIVMGVNRPSRGDRVWLLVDAIPHLTADGEVQDVVCTFTDISERKRLEESFLYSQKLEVVGHFAGSVAHDFNNLLSVIVSFASFVDEGLPSGSALRQDAQAILDTAMRGAQLTRRLLTFARKDVVVPEIVSVSDEIASLQPSLARLLGEHVRLVCSADDGSLRVRIDRTQLEQLVFNLTINARDAMPRGGTVRIECTSTVLPVERASALGVAPGAYVVLVIRDDGEGIPPEALPHIFEPFFTTKGPTHGTGLGLASVREIVRACAGAVAVESTAGEGTTFRIYLPRREEDAAAARVDAAVAPPRGTEVVLLVEDEEPVREAGARALAAAGYEVVVARNADEALVAAREARGRRIELLVTDVVLPGMGGPELHRALTAMLPGLKVLYASGYVGTTIEALGVDSTSAAFLQKPFTPAQLAVRVRELLDGTNAAARAP